MIKVFEFVILAFLSKYDEFCDYIENLAVSRKKLCFNKVFNIFTDI